MLAQNHFADMPKLNVQNEDWRCESVLFGLFLRVRKPTNLYRHTRGLESSFRVQCKAKLAQHTRLALQILRLSRWRLQASTATTAGIRRGAVGFPIVSYVRGVRQRRP
jgi:hypothetical protein